MANDIFKKGDQIDVLSDKFGTVSVGDSRTGYFTGNGVILAVGKRATAVMGGGDATMSGTLYAEDKDGTKYKDNYVLGLTKADEHGKLMRNSLGEPKLVTVNRTGTSGFRHHVPFGETLSPLLGAEQAASFARYPAAQTLRGVIEKIEQLFSVHTEDYAEAQKKGVEQQALNRDIVEAEVKSGNAKPEAVAESIDEAQNFIASRLHEAEQYANQLLKVAEAAQIPPVKEIISGIKAYKAAVQPASVPQRTISGPTA